MIKNEECFAKIFKKIKFLYFSQNQLNKFVHYEKVCKKRGCSHSPINFMFN